jgi:hypothetical protein
MRGDKNRREDGRAADGAQAVKHSHLFGEQRAEFLHGIADVQAHIFLGGCSQAQPQTPPACEDLSRRNQNAARQFVGGLASAWPASGAHDHSSGFR